VQGRKLLQQCYRSRVAQHYTCATFYTTAAAAAANVAVCLYICLLLLLHRLQLHQQQLAQLWKQCFAVQNQLGITAAVAPAASSTATF
jgi:hypothetical protein